MKFNELNEHNYMLFAIKFYDNPQALTKEDFEDDLKRIKYIKRLLKHADEYGISLKKYIPNKTYYKREVSTILIRSRTLL